jgi:maltooligosyltrehalose trehalohydrolase
MDVASLNEDSVVVVRRWHEKDEVVSVFNFNDREVRLQKVPYGVWHKRLDSADERWLGKGPAAPEKIDATGRDGLTVQAHSVLVFEKEIED